MGEAIAEAISMGIYSSRWAHLTGGLTKNLRSWGPTKILLEHRTDHPKSTPRPDIPLISKGIRKLLPMKLTLPREDHLEEVHKKKTGTKNWSSAGWSTTERQSLHPSRSAGGGVWHKEDLECTGIPRLRKEQPRTLLCKWRKPLDQKRWSMGNPECRPNTRWV